MRQLLLFRWFLLLFLGLGSLSVAQASHLRGGDITYASVASTTAGVPRYHVVARSFYEVTGVPAYSTATLTASRAGCGAAAPNVLTAQLTLTSTTDSPPLNCNGNTPMYRVSRYEADLDLPSGQWLLSTVVSSRNASIVNINNAAATDLYLSAFLDNTFKTQDASPVFESVIQPYLGLGAVPPHSFSAFDADGDSLRYETMLPLNACGTPTVSTMAPGFQLNTSSGAITQLAAASAQGTYDMTVRVSEYRRIAGAWQLIGTVMRESIYLAYSTTNQPPTFTSMQVSGGPAQSPGQRIPASPGQSVSVTLTATDPDAGQLLRFTTEATNVVPGLTLTTLTATQARLTWQVPASLPPGRYYIPVAVLDNGCSVSASEDRTLLFLVTNQVLATRAATAAVATAYPMPFREQVQFVAPAGQPLTIVNALGRVVAQLTSAADGRVLWQPAATLPAGLYLARSADGQFLARLLRADN